jgi:ferredoxin
MLEGAATETKIYYFSTTGNSLNLARALARGLGGAKLVPMAGAAGAQATGGAERVGFIFPVYAWGLPRLVAEFAEKIRFEGRPYVFAAATCGGTPGRTLRELRTLLRKAGVDLHAGFVCREGANTLMDDPGFIRFARRLNRIRYPSGEERLSEMLGVIRAGKAHKPETSSLASNCFGAMMHGLMKLAGDKLKAYDDAYSVDENCTGCRTCERVCPRGNVRLEGGKPAWHHDCEMCNACIQWCPQNAIHIANETCRYRHPEVRAADLFLR